MLIVSGNTKVLFDPLYENNYDRYQLVPAAMQRDLLAGKPPFDDIDAVFVSHHHGDHFTPELMLQYLLSQPTVRLYAPMQAVAALRSAIREAGADEENLAERIVGIALENGDPAMTMDADDLSIGVVRIPHSGWPESRTDIENLSFRVTLDEGTTVTHFGDADANLQHFEPYRDYWSAATTDLAVPPYWFFQSAAGHEILDDIVRSEQSLGTHVPVELSEADTDNLADYDLLTQPGERRRIVVSPRP